MYFRLLDKGEKKTFNCHANNESGSAIIVRRNVRQLAFDRDLSDQETTWYLSQLLDDVIWRFKVNFAVLFSCSGKEVMSIRAGSLQCDLIDRLSRRPLKVRELVYNRFNLFECFQHGSDVCCGYAQEIE